MDQDYKIADAFASYLATNSQKKTVSSQKIDRRVLAIAQHFFEKELGQSLMSEVRVEALEQFEIWASSPQKCGDISKEAWSVSSILRHGKTLKSIFRKAFLTGRIQRDPGALWKLSNPEPGGKRRPMAKDELAKLLTMADPWFRPILRILAATGARGSAIARLRWSDVDLVNSALFFTSRKGGTKREKKIVFPITDEVRQILEEIKPAGEFVFLKDGQPLTPPLISMTGYRLIKRAGLTGVCIYSLRHAFATDLLESDISPEIARRLMGHSDVKTIQHYTSHLSIDPLKRAASHIRGKK